MIQNQAYTFMLFIINGISIGILFDIFRITRKTFKTCDFITYIQDTIFWILSGILTLYFIFIFNNGEIRLYIFLGIILGIVLYMLSISKYFIKINTFILEKIKKVVEIILLPIRKILRILLFRPISFIFINFNKIFKHIFTKKLIKLPKTEETKKDF